MTSSVAHRSRAAWRVLLACLLLCCAPVDASAQQGDTQGGLGRNPYDEDGGSGLNDGVFGEDPGGQSPTGYYDPNIDAATEGATDGLAVEPWTAEPWGGYRFEGPYKGTSLRTTWLEPSDLGFTDIDLKTKFEFAPAKYTTLAFTPGFGYHLVDGPNMPDLPARLHDLFLDVKLLQPFSETFAMEFGVTPGLYSDFQDGTSNAFRFGARTITYWLASPSVRWVAGLMYLDRDDVDWLPVAGLVYTPNPATVYTLVFPESRIAKRISCHGCCENWFYLAGELGGGSWAVQRDCGCSDTANYYDIRFSVGLERKIQNGPSAHVEVGYVFGRRLEYQSPATPIFKPGDTLMARAGVSF